MPGGNAEATATVGTGEVTVAFSPDGKLLAYASSGNTVHLSAPRGGKVLHRLSPCTPSSPLAFSPTGGVLATGGEGGAVKLWDSTAGTLRQDLRGHRGSIASLAFSPNGRLLASGGGDNTVRLWDTSKWAPK